MISPLKVSQNAIDEIARKGGHATVYAAKKPKADG
jgi:hypothetical protein